MEWTIFLWLLGILLAIVILLVQRRHNSEHEDISLLESTTALYRGTAAERDLVLKLLKGGMSSSMIFHDLYLRKRNGGYSQIDLVAVTTVGIIVFEVKDYSGWIFGKGYQPYWTQVLAHGKEKYRFYNPVMQNNGHIEALRQRLNIFVNIPFYSVIVFYGNCVLRNVSAIPTGTFLVKSWEVNRIIEHILENNTPLVYPNKTDIMGILYDAVKNGDRSDIRAEHIRPA